MDVNSEVNNSTVACLQAKWMEHDQQPHIFTSLQPSQETLDIFSQTSMKTRKIVILRYRHLTYRFYKGEIGILSLPEFGTPETHGRKSSVESHVQ